MIEREPMTIVPVAPSIPAPPIHGSRPGAQDAQSARGEGLHPDSTKSASAASAASVSSKLTPARSFVTPTLPPGVLFVEEPSGIKIYVGSKQVNPTEVLPSPAIAREEAE
jgi:hypothetical protein